MIRQDRTWHFRDWPLLSGSDSGICPGPSEQTPEDSGPGSPRTSFPHRRPKMTPCTDQTPSTLHTCKPTAVLINQERGTHCINLVQDLPLLVGHTEGLGCLDGSLHLTGPYLQVTDALWLDELAQLFPKLQGEEKRFYITDPVCLKQTALQTYSISC